VAKRSGKIGGSPLARLAFFKATPVNRDTLRILDLTPGKAKRKEKNTNKPRSQALLTPKPMTSEPKVRLVTAAEASERKAKTCRTFGFDKMHVVAPNSSFKR
jgi:hypothetical protein